MYSIIASTEPCTSAVFTAKVIIHVHVYIAIYFICMATLPDGIDINTCTQYPLS